MLGIGIFCFNTPGASIGESEKAAAVRNLPPSPSAIVVSRARSFYDHQQIFIFFLNLILNLFIFVI